MVGAWQGEMAKGEEKAFFAKRMGRIRRIALRSQKRGVEKTNPRASWAAMDCLNRRSRLGMTVRSCPCGRREVTDEADDCFALRSQGSRSLKKRTERRVRRAIARFEKTKPTQLSLVSVGVRDSRKETARKPSRSQEWPPYALAVQRRSTENALIVYRRFAVRSQLRGRPRK